MAGNAEYIPLDNLNSHENSHKIRVGPSRWKTPEFYFYYLVFIVNIPLMFRCAIKFSSPNNVNYPKYKDLLSDGWIFDRKADVSDAQTNSFRSFAFILLYVLISHVTISRIIQALPSSVNVKYRKIYSLIFSIIFLIVLYGTSLIKILLILSLNYYIAKHFGKSKMNPILTWILNIAILFLNDYFQGYKFSALWSGLSFLDKRSGLMPRWFINYNYCVLRSISFNLDYYWCLKNKEESKDTESKIIENNSMKDYKARVKDSLLEKDYNFFNYLIYLLYVPLYLAGPIITFNDFIYQINHRNYLPVKKTVLYAIRFVAICLLFEWTIHYMYVNAIIRRRAYENFSPFDYSMLAYFSLNNVWLKLLIIWRFFRLWALADNIDTVENMNRSMSNNYSMAGFWRAWHSSYNKWNIRYIYIPLGGNKNPIINNAVVFTFVAIWHDISLKLLEWSWLIIIFLIPEIVCTKFIDKRIRHLHSYRFIKSIGASSNIVLMITANMVGYVIGLDGAKEILGEIFAPQHILSWLYMFFCIMVTTQVMFEIREEEKRRGIFKKY
ncbi:MBOAT-domain-containing protein [Neocallimastix californiae]|uniref:MBOAT-domain-containing protein n=1 Tax=Neocallimastix californiae TaxID=1754190 RepID=A0A1Y2D806_9FUNG|nr:MBOAT-domain-containing protein [Neocallimastix californiae]|eukprot:ORY55390.1 MBOAT-domain-containing protein [Neocallimastix californiae]